MFCYAFKKSLHHAFLHFLIHTNVLPIITPQNHHKEHRTTHKLNGNIQLFWPLLTLYTLTQITQLSKVQAQEYKHITLPPLATSKAIPTNNDDPQDCSI